MELSTQHSIYFDYKSRTDVEDVIASLQGLNSFVSALPAVLEYLYPGVKFSDVQLSIDKLETGSLYEDIFVKLIFGSQQQLDQDIATIRAKLRLDDPRMRLLVVLLLMGLAGYGMVSAAVATASSFMKPEGERQAVINNYKVIVVDSAKLAGTTPEEIEKAIAEAMKNEKTAAESAINFLQPARKDPASSVTFDTTYKIDSQAIQQTPTYYIDPSSEAVEHFKNVPIQIRAVNLDSSKQGWAARAPSVTGDRRMRLQITPGLDMLSLYGKAEVIGDISVVYKKPANSEQQTPSYIILTALR